jgi:hypothetical protein
MGTDTRADTTGIKIVGEGRKFSSSSVTGYVFPYTDGEGNCGALIVEHKIMRSYSAATGFGSLREQLIFNFPGCDTLKLAYGNESLEWVSGAAEKNVDARNDSRVLRIRDIKSALIDKIDLDAVALLKKGLDLLADSA